jgi:hypothetical protein
MHAEMAGVQVQVLQLDLGQAAVRQRSNSSLMASQTRLTVERDSAASGPSASARAASTSRVDRPRTYPAMTSASNALVRVTCLPSSRDANTVSVPRSLGRSSVTGPAVVLTVTGWWPLR